MRRSRDFHALRGACAVALALVLTSAALDARADASPGTETLGRARDAWDRGEFDTSEPLYKEALDRGGLSPKETLDCFVHLGAARAVIGRKSAALVAFRQAAILDPHFTVPREAGKRAVHLATQAKRDAAKIGAFQIRAEVPDAGSARKPFRVTATLDATHAALASRIGVVARDPASDASFEKSEPASTTVSFEIPGSVAVPDATVSVRFDALDAHDNRLVSLERKVKIGSAPQEAAAPVAVNPRPSGANAKADPNAWAKPIPDKKDEKESKGGGFWSSPWPYVIGGAALAAGGAAVYLGTRPTDDVVVGSASLRLR